MAINKLSAQLMDAYMMGDEDLIEQIKAEIDKKVEEAKPKKKTNSIQLNNVLNDDRASAIKVHDFMENAFGEDWWELELETIEQLLLSKHGVALEDVNRDKLWAIRHLCRSDAAFTDWYEFNQMALAFSGSIADFEYLRSPSPGMVISALKVMNHIRPDREMFLSNEVLKYICIVLKEDGIYTPPPSIDNIIGDTMKKMVSEDMKAQWSGVKKCYSDIVNKKKVEPEETIADIQAKRILKAEGAAIEYG